MGFCWYLHVLVGRQQRPWGAEDRSRCYRPEVCLVPRPARPDPGRPETQRGLEPFVSSRCPRAQSLQSLPGNCFSSPHPPPWPAQPRPSPGARARDRGAGLTSSAHAWFP